jgi:predicted PurR-regulated permease PerM
MELKVSNRTIIRVVLIVLGAYLTLKLVGALRTQLVWIFSALFLALALEPAVERLSRYMPKRNRGLAALVILLAVIAVVGFVLVALVPPFASQTYHLISNLPAAYESFVAGNPQIGGFINSHLNTADTANAVQQFSKQLLSFGGSAVGVAKSLFGGVVALVTILLLTLFMVLEGPRWVELVWKHAPAQTRSRYAGLLKQMHGTVTGYVGGNIFTSMVASIATVALLLILHAPYAFALGLLVGIMDLIPMIGATLAAVLVTIVVLVFNGPVAALIAFVFFLIYQQFENNILQPIVFSKTVEVSPLVTMVALIVGVPLAGFLGALIAIPVAASLQILLRYWLSERKAS